MRSSITMRGMAKARKERDEDLILFREMFKREKEIRNVSLLDPVSSEFESSQGDTISVILLNQITEPNIELRHKQVVLYLDYTILKLSFHYVYYQL